MSDQLNLYKVKTYHPKTGRCIHVKVQAEYYVVDGGSLVFRIKQENNYPRAVHRFAAGHWSEVISV